QMQTTRHRTALPDTDETLSFFTRSGEESLTLYLIDQQERLLNSEKPLSQLDKWQLQQALSLSSLSVPASWRGVLPSPDQDGKYWLTMQQDGDCWLSE